MEEIIVDLSYSRAHYLRQINSLKDDIARQRGYIESAEDRITAIQEQLDHAQAFVDNYEEAIRLLGGNPDECQEQ